MQNADPAEQPSPDQVVASLTGDLLCAACRYQLRGLSVRTKCPECGLPVSTTILTVVDPRASELQPINAPLLVAGGLVLWSAGAVAAAVGAWTLIADTASRAFLNGALVGEWAVWLVLAGVLLSGVGAIALVRPHAQIAGWAVASAAAGVVLYLPLAFAVWQIHGVLDPVLGGPVYFELRAGLGERTAWRLMACAMIMLIVVLLRPNARLLAGRSMLMRTGRVDRQTMLVLVVALGVAMVGDLTHLVVSGLHGPVPDAARVVGTVLIGVGSALFTVGLVGVMIDCLRICRVVLKPPISYRDILGRSEETGAEQAKRESTQ